MRPLDGFGGLFFSHSIAASILRREFQTMYLSTIFQALSDSLAFWRVALTRMERTTTGKTVNRNQIDSIPLCIYSVPFFYASTLPAPKVANNLTFSPATHTFGFNVSQGNHVTKEALRLRRKDCGRRYVERAAKRSSPRVIAVTSAKGIARHGQLGRILDVRIRAVRQTHRYSTVCWDRNR